MSNRLESIKTHMHDSRPAPIWREAFHLAWAEGEGLSRLHRLGKAMGASFRAMPAVILPGELIVGGLYLEQIARFTHGGCIECDGALAERKRGENPALVDEVLARWRSDTTLGKIISEWSPEERIRQEQCVYWAGAWCGHAILDFTKPLAIGIEGIRRGIEERLRELRQRASLATEASVLAPLAGRLTLDAQRPYDHEGFYRGLLEVCDGMLAFAEAHAVEARSLAAVEQDPTHGAELDKIADICERVPAKGARGFHEALQSFWFIHLLDGNDSPGRMDQFLEPYYRRSLESGEITPESAQGLVDCLWLKFNEVRSWNVCIGGLKRNGTDGVNPISYMFLESQRKFRMQAPNLSLRLTRETEPEFLLAACDVIRGGGGMPALYNDETMVAALESYGIPSEDARDYALNGCAQVDIQGKSHMGLEDGEINLLKCFELALHHGVELRTGGQLGPRTGDPLAFNSFGDLMTAYKRQVEFFAEKICESANLAQRIRSEHAPNLIRSVFIEDCIAKGIDYNTGGPRYNDGQILTQGIANTADSLASIKKLVFEEKRIEMARLLAALEKNFEGEEPLRQQLLNGAPKYGNDDPYVDSIAAEIIGHWFTELKKHKTWRGGAYGGGVIVFVRLIPFGAVIGATPDGRRAGTPLADSVGPTQGMDKRGPTAALNSVARLDQKLAPCSVVLNLKLSPDSVAGDEGLKKLAALVKGYFAQGGQQLQINVVDRETLVKAKENPEAYRSLVVRVGGFSAYYAQLDPALQEDILSRTESSF